MAYQYGSRSRYPLASAALNPRSPPNVIPTSSLVQMAPGTSLRSFATQGGVGLPPAYPYRQGLPRSSPLSYQQLRPAQACVSPVISASCMNFHNSSSVAEPQSCASHVGSVRVESLMGHTPRRSGFAVTGMNAVDSPPMSPPAPMFKCQDVAGHSFSVPLHSQEPALTANHCSPPISPNDCLGTPCPDSSACCDYMMAVPNSPDQFIIQPERDKHSCVSGVLYSLMFCFLYVL